jgi:hypothetical protein
MRFLRFFLRRDKIVNVAATRAEATRGEAWRPLSHPRRASALEATARAVPGARARRERSIDPFED